MTLHTPIECKDKTQNDLTHKKNSVVLFRERTIPTERPPPVGEVSANFCGYRGVTWSAQRVPTAVNLFSRPEPLLFYSSSSSVDLTRLTRLSGPRSTPTTTQKNLVAPGIEPETSGSVARNSAHQTTEAVMKLYLRVYVNP